MADDQNRPPIYGTPDYPFSGALRSGPLADLLASVVGLPGDLQQIALNISGQRGQTPLLPTSPQILQGQANWNTAQGPADWTLPLQMSKQPLSYSTAYTKAPELSAAFMGAPTAQDMRPWLRNMRNMIGFPLPSQPAPDDSPGRIGRHPQAYR
jgi:hypothetical protein